MSSIPYVLLSLLAREPLSGYDIKQQMAGRINPFYKINNNQLYPVLSKLEAEGLVKLQAHERESYRPAKKIYAITDQGLASLKAWVIEPSEPGQWDEFLMKMYNSWLIDRKTLIPILENKRSEHDGRSRAYAERVAGFRAQGPLASDDPFFSTVAVIEMGVGFERMYVEWCDKMLGWLRANQA
ncbi:PadR family transcriptional regulator [Paenibacillus athensensis]|uniref:PadR family transcriptional regulator n=1 Tax=Paenibacillus athensensis TaxID=1967502 RepID=A0A4Y8Q9M9_9BACL|nr:PadR family transcriptional regulator [Paenibacillus athensensis]MCD1260146.1 PadR family transcriptional regulator [Paenibacillus athensensis]